MGKLALINPDSIKESIRQRIDLVEFISRDVALKRKGRDFAGLCPFHREKTPSFYVSPDKGIFKCFGCGAGGDLFSYVQLREDVEFGEAVRMLAQEAGIDCERGVGGSPMGSVNHETERLRRLQRPRSRSHRFAEVCRIQWEYRLEPGRYETDGRLVRWLNQWGGGGWEAIQVQRSHRRGCETAKLHVAFKRQVRNAGSTSPPLSDLSVDMAPWEYRIEVAPSRTHHDLVDWLNACGCQGWAAFQLGWNEFHAHGQAGIRVFFKRAVSGSPVVAGSSRDDTLKAFAGSDSS